MTFNIGDKIESAIDYPDGNTKITKGLKGIIIPYKKASWSDYAYAVVWDKQIADESLNSHYRQSENQLGRIWLVRSYEIKLVENLTQEQRVIRKIKYLDDKWAKNQKEKHGKV